MRIGSYGLGFGSGFWFLVYSVVVYWPGGWGSIPPLFDGKFFNLIGIYEEKSQTPPPPKKKILYNPVLRHRILQAFKALSLKLMSL